MVILLIFNLFISLLFRFYQFFSHDIPHIFIHHAKNHVMLNNSIREIL